MSALRLPGGLGCSRIIWSVSEYDFIMASSWMNEAIQAKTFNTACNGSLFAVVVISIAPCFVDGRKNSRRRFFFEESKYANSAVVDKQVRNIVIRDSILDKGGGCILDVGF